MWVRVWVGSWLAGKCCTWREGLSERWRRACCDAAVARITWRVVVLFRRLGVRVVGVLGGSRWVSVGTLAFDCLGPPFCGPFLDVARRSLPFCGRESGSVLFLRLERFVFILRLIGRRRDHFGRLLHRPPLPAHMLGVLVRASPASLRNRRSPAVIEASSVPCRVDPAL